MEQNKLSLSKKLDGGYLHVKKGGSNVKHRRNSRGYSNYLNRLKSQTKPGQLKKEQTGGKSDKVVAITFGGRKASKKKPSKKSHTTIKDISTSTIIPQKKVEAKQVEAKQVEAKQVEAKQVESKQKQGVKIQLPITKGSLKKGKVLKRSQGKSHNAKHKSNSRRINKSLTRRRKHDLKKGKRISVSKIRKLSDKDVSSIQGKLKDIKGKSTQEIKQELDKQGIKVSGKSPSILKDIYIYSQLCGINITRE